MGGLRASIMSGNIGTTICTGDLLHCKLCPTGCTSRIDFNGAQWGLISRMLTSETSKLTSRQNAGTHKDTDPKAAAAAAAAASAQLSVNGLLHWIVPSTVGAMSETHVVSHTVIFLTTYFEGCSAISSQVF